MTRWDERVVERGVERRSLLWRLGRWLDNLSARIAAKGGTDLDPRIEARRKKRGDA